MSAEIWSRIEAVITGRTRNAFALRGTRVRIPPTPLDEKKPSGGVVCLGASFAECFSQPLTGALQNRIARLPQSGFLIPDGEQGGGIYQLLPYVHDLFFPFHL